MNETLELHPEADDQQLLAYVLGYYQRTLQTSVDAQDYLRKRGIANSQAIAHFGIGYADRSLGLHLPSKQVKAGRAIRGRLEALGLFRESGHEHFNGSIVFPIRAGDGTRRILDMFGRKILQNLRKGTPLHTYLSTERHGVWNIEAFGPSDEIILCPSLFDALTFWSNGYRNVTCMFGPAALTAEHMAAFQEFRIKRVLTPCEGVCPKLMEAGIDCFLLSLPRNLDANAIACRSDDPTQTLGAILRSAIWFGKGAVPANRPAVVAASIEIPATSDNTESVPPPHVITVSTLEVTSPPATSTPKVLSALLGEVLPPKDDLPAAMVVATPQKDPVPAPKPPEPKSPVAPVQTASPLPPAPIVNEADVKDDEMTMTFGIRRYRVRGWTKNLSYDQLRVNVMVSADRNVFVDTFDLYSAKHRRSFTTQAATEFGVEEQSIKKDLGRLLLKLEELQDDFIAKSMEPKAAHPLMTEQERQEAIRFLREPDLLDRIATDFQVVGESTNKLVCYLAAVSRKLDRPLACAT